MRFRFGLLGNVCWFDQNDTVQCDRSIFGTAGDFIVWREVSAPSANFRWGIFTQARTCGGNVLIKIVTRATPKPCYVHLQYTNTKITMQIMHEFTELSNYPTIIAEFSKSQFERQQLS